MAADLAKVYDAVLSGQPGFFSRDEDWWERVLDDPAEERQGSEPAALPAGGGRHEGRRRCSRVRALPEHAPVGGGHGACPMA